MIPAIAYYISMNLVEIVFSTELPRTITSYDDAKLLVGRRNREEPHVAIERRILFISDDRTSIRVYAWDHIDDTHENILLYETYN
jgi:hypothetical protein